jgi:hypothetical protein
MNTVCARLWQAEAVEDGRLVGAERAAFERHAPGCPECRGKLEALAQLRQLVGQLPASESTPFERKRQREQLLARADAAVSRPASRLGWWIGGGIGLAAAAATALFVLAAPPELPARLTPVALAAPAYQLEPSPGGRWHEVASGATTRVALVSGHFELAVDRLTDGQHFVVDLPDGEAEVIGARVIIAADGTTTRTVVVVEGRVLLRLEGQSERVLEAGQAYRAAETAALVPPPAVIQPEAPPAEPVAAQPVAPARPTAGEDFAAAMDAFSSGDFGRAETLLAAFVAEHGGDSRVEDAAYLRVVARARRGDPAGARLLAREYLERYPAGFRRRVVEGLAAEAAAPGRP